MFISVIYSTQCPKLFRSHHCSPRRQRDVTERSTRPNGWRSTPFLRLHSWGGDQCRSGIRLYNFNRDGRFDGRDLASTNDMMRAACSDADFGSAGHANFARSAVLMYCQVWWHCPSVEYRRPVPRPCAVDVNVNIQVPTTASAPCPPPQEREERSYHDSAQCDPTSRYF